MVEKWYLTTYDHTTRFHSGSKIVVFFLSLLYIQCVIFRSEFHCNEREPYPRFLLKAENTHTKYSIYMRFPLKWSIGWHPLYHNGSRRRKEKEKKKKINHVHRSFSVIFFLFIRSSILPTICLFCGRMSSV